MASSSSSSSHAPAPAPAEPQPAPPAFDWEALLSEKRVWRREDPELVKDLRSDHAGETGAVHIYVGAAAAMQLGPAERFGAGARAFVAAHRATEEQHLAYFDRLLERSERSKLLPLWRLMGYGLGFLPTLALGERGLYCTVEAVEAFVEVHYQQHLVPLAARPRQGPYHYPELCRLLRACCEDEVHHKEDARERWLAPGEERPLWAKLWAKVVGAGSGAAVAVCRNI